MVVMLAATLSGCRLAKKDEDGTVKKTVYGAYAVVGKSLDDPDIPDPEMEGTTVGQNDKKGFVHFKKLSLIHIYTIGIRVVPRVDIKNSSLCGRVLFLLPEYRRKSNLIREYRKDQ